MVCGVLGVCGFTGVGGFLGAGGRGVSGGLSGGRRFSSFSIAKKRAMMKMM